MNINDVIGKDTAVRCRTDKEAIRICELHCESSSSIRDWVSNETCYIFDGDNEGSWRVRQLKDVDKGFAIVESDDIYEESTFECDIDVFQSYVKELMRVKEENENLHTYVKEADNFIKQYESGEKIGSIQWAKTKFDNGVEFMMWNDLKVDNEFCVLQEVHEDTAPNKPTKNEWCCIEDSHSIGELLTGWSEIVNLKVSSETTQEEIIEFMSKNNLTVRELLLFNCEMKE